MCVVSHSHPICLAREERSYRALPIQVYFHDYQTGWMMQVGCVSAFVSSIPSFGLPPVERVDLKCLALKRWSSLVWLTRPKLISTSRIACEGNGCGVRSVYDWNWLNIVKLCRPDWEWATNCSVEGFRTNLEDQISACQNWLSAKQMIECIDCWIKKEQNNSEICRINNSYLASYWFSHLNCVIRVLSFSLARYKRCGG